MRDVMNKELRASLDQLKAAEDRFNMAAPGYVDAAAHELAAAQAKVRELLREFLRGNKNGQA